MRLRGWATRLRWAGPGLALLCWAGLLAMTRLAPPAPFASRPARLLLQSEASTPPSSTPPPTPRPSPKAPSVAEEQLIEDAARRMPSLPLDFWHRHKDEKGRFYKNKDCSPLPSIFELEFAETYWQSAHTSTGTFHIWGAYLDRRNASRIGPAVRILTVHNRIKPKLSTHCQIWFENRTEPVLVRTLEYKYVWNSKWGNYRDHVWQPYLVACVLPTEVRDELPTAVSLVENACSRATNLLKVHFEPPKSGNPFDYEVGVCVKGLDFLHEDLSLRLIEWLELILLLGASKVHLYELQVHPNVSKVLRYYEKRGDVTITPMTLPGGQPNLPALQHMYLKKKTTHKRQMELIPYNDCLYRNMYRYKRLALLDVDEVIVPLLDDDWPSLLRRAEKTAGTKPRSSYHASNVYYLDSLGPSDDEAVASVPTYMHMMRHVWRAQNFTKPGQYVKAFHETGRVLTLHNHFPLACLGGACSSYALPTSEARLQHYRADCVTALSKSCDQFRRDPVRDPALWTWRERLETRVRRALTDLQLLPLDELTPHR